MVRLNKVKFFIYKLKGDKYNVQETLPEDCFSQVILVIFSGAIHSIPVPCMYVTPVSLISPIIPSY